MDFVCLGGLGFFFLRLVVFSSAVLFYQGQTFILNNNDSFCFYFVLLPAIPPWQTCTAERGGRLMTDRTDPASNSLERGVGRTLERGTGRTSDQEFKG